MHDGNSTLNHLVPLVQIISNMAILSRFPIKKEYFYQVLRLGKLLEQWYFLKIKNILYGSMHRMKEFLITDSARIYVVLDNSLTGPRKGK